MMFKSIIAGILVGSFIVALMIKNDVDTPMPVIYGDTSVIKLQEGELWSQPWAPEPSYAFPMEED